MRRQWNFGLSNLKKFRTVSILANYFETALFEVRSIPLYERTYYQYRNLSFRISSTYHRQSIRYLGGFRDWYFLQSRSRRRRYEIVLLQICTINLSCCVDIGHPKKKFFIALTFITLLVFSEGNIRARQQITTCYCYWWCVSGCCFTWYFGELKLESKKWIDIV